MMKYYSHPILRDIIDYIAETYGLVITETYRKKRHLNDLHGEVPVRAYDIRTWCYSDKLALEIMHNVNQQWSYDPSRPDMECFIIHDSGHGRHAHIQVHPNTRRN
jgi:hypothetical protein